uniref:WD_REPEATS_REGION domain-containing protein n=1 Tax=Caenorhabditis japonica TaxID=281687 RepID=A0A8R1HPE8_CAEJA
MEAKKFKKLDLHGEQHDKKLDNPENPFIMTAKIRLPQDSVYNCDFNPYIGWEQTQVLATVGGTKVLVHEVPRHVNHIITRYGCTIASSTPNQEPEDLYAVTWALDTYESPQNAHRIVTGGLHGQLYVINSRNGQQQNRLQSCGGAINDIRTSPANSNLVAVASKDQTVRIFHIRNDSCLAVMGGLNCHRDQVLSLDWDRDGNFLVSCGMDHLSMRWDLAKDHVRKHLDACCEALAKGRMNVLSQSDPVLKKVEDKKEIIKENVKKSAFEIENYHPNLEDDSNIDSVLGEIGKASGCTLPIYRPASVCSDVHEDYVDCIRVMPGINYFLSKGCGKEKAVNMWRFGPPKGVVERVTSSMAPQKTTTQLLAFKIWNGDTWFTKFEMDPRRRWLAVGGTQGFVNFFDVTKLKSHEPVLRVKVFNGTVRNTCYCAQGRIMIAVGEQGAVTRLDRVPLSIDTAELAKCIPK